MILVDINNIFQSQTFNKFKAFKVRFKLWEMTIEGTFFK